jgi:hypothetical protein
MKFIIIFFSLILTLSWISSSYAYRGGRGFYNRPFIGGYGYSPGFYRHYMGYGSYPGIYYSSPIVNYSYIQRPPPVVVRKVVREVEVPMSEYIELPAEQISSTKKDDANYWYYCRKTDAYYPKVETCSSGWMQVIPHNNK